MLANFEAEHIQLEVTSHRKPGRVRYHVSFLLIHHKALVRYLTFRRRMPRREQQIAEVVFRRSFGGHSHRDDSVAANRLLYSALQMLLWYRHTELEETISYVDTVLKLFKRDRCVEQLPLRIVGQVRRYQVVRVRDKEEFVDGMNRLTFIFLILFQQQIFRPVLCNSVGFTFQIVHNKYSHAVTAALTR